MSSQEPQGPQCCGHASRVRAWVAWSYWGHDTRGDDRTAVVCHWQGQCGASGSAGPRIFWGFLSADAPKTCSKGSLQMGLSKTGGCPKLFLSGELEVLNRGIWGVTQFSDTEAVMWRARIQQAVAPLGEQPHYWGRGPIVISSHLWFCYPPYQPVVVMWGPAIWPAVRWWFTRSSKSQEIRLLCQARSSYLPSCVEARIAGGMENVAMVGSMNQLWRCTIKVTIIFRGRGKIHKLGHFLLDVVIYLFFWADVTSSQATILVSVPFSCSSLNLKDETFSPSLVVCSQLTRMDHRDVLSKASKRESPT